MFVLPKSQKCKLFSSCIESPVVMSVIYLVGSAFLAHRHIRRRERRTSEQILGAARPAGKHAATRDATGQARRQVTVKSCSM